MPHRDRVGLLRPRIQQRTVILAIITEVIRVVRLWKKRADDRWELARLTRRELQDIGVSEYEAYLESRKPFWRE